jgi:hypothetical protein
VGLLRREPVVTERAYRLFLQEFPEGECRPGGTLELRIRANGKVVSTAANLQPASSAIFLLGGAALARPDSEPEAHGAVMPMTVNGVSKGDGNVIVTGDDVLLPAPRSRGHRSAGPRRRAPNGRQRSVRVPALAGPPGRVGDRGLVENARGRAS